MISEVEIANKYHNANISVMFVTRSFDYKCDARIKNLFVSNKEKSDIWKEIEVDSLLDSEVEAIVGRCYASLSRKLKELLRTPASLYVWMQLDEARHSQVITSANQLLHEWWSQILERCDLKSISRAEVNLFIQNVVEQLSSMGVFSLPRKPFVAHEQIIEALVSEGLLVDNASKVTFMHQTYLDYFVVNSYLNQVTSGKSVIDIIGDRDNQTPNLRYRFFVLLQELCEYDEKYFLEQCEEILSSDKVRHYYKCIVFDAAAQQANPSRVFCEFIEKYWSEPDWHEYIREVAYFGNYPLIKHLIESGRVECLSDEGMWLLRSVNEKKPDFIVNTLKPYCFENAETDQKVYNCLCFDVDDDSDDMFLLRIGLLRNNPALLESTWIRYYHLFKKGSPRIIDYLLLILDSGGKTKLRTIYFPDSKEFKNFAKENYKIIVDTVIPKLCQVTAGMASKADELWYDDSYARWNAKGYNEGALRKVVQIAKIAICEFAEQNPEEFLQKVVCEEYSEALVGNELILAAIEKLPIEFADATICWITEAFPKHIFDFTGYKSDYLAITKRILEKFTPHCEQGTFNNLEKCILNWSESSDWMVSMFKHRLEISKTCPVYYAYWGFMQKELLLAMDQSRLSVTSKELLAVLKRNEWVRTPHYAYPVSSGQAKRVTSPISKYTDRISDKTWLQIIETPPEKMKAHSGKETKSAYIEATHVQFASSLGAQAKKQPVRFANLSLQFPEKCYSGYISEVLRAQQNRDQEGEYANVELTSQIIQRYSGTANEEILGNIADVVESRAKEEWTEDILNIIQSIALTPVVKSGGWQSPDESEKTAHSLYIEVLNTPQGKAIRAITSLIFANPEHFARFRETISTLATSSEPFVLLALTDCAVACYNADIDFSLAIFKKLIVKDVRLYMSHNAWEIIRRDYEKESAFYREGLLAAINSEYTDLGEEAAGMLCAVAICYEDFEAQKNLLELHFTDKQANSICKQAVSCFDNDKYREICKKIISRMAQEHTLEFYALSPDFFHENTRIERDKDFLLQLVSSNAKSGILVALLKFLCNTEENILDFAEVIYAVIKQAASLSDDGSMRIDMDEMVRCVAHLYDVGKDKPEILTICLDTWDELFKNNLRDIHSLSTMLDNFN